MLAAFNQPSVDNFSYVPMLYKFALRRGVPCGVPCAPCAVGGGLDGNGGGAGAPGVPCGGRWEVNALYLWFIILKLV